MDQDDDTNPQPSLAALEAEHEASPAPGGPPALSSLHRVLHRLSLGERERLLAEAVEAIAQASGARTVTAWLVSDVDPGYRRVAAVGAMIGLSDRLPEPIANLFRAHHHPEIQHGEATEAMLVSLDREELPAEARKESLRLDAQLLVTLPATRTVQGVILVGPPRGEHHPPGLVGTLVRLGAALGRALAAARNREEAEIESRVKAPLHFIARLEEELARAERFKRALTVLWVAVDPPPGLSEAQADTLVATIGSWLAATLRVMDSIGRRPDHAFVAVLPETSRAGAQLLKTRLASLASEQDFGIGRAQRAKLRLRVGIASYPEEGVSSRFLLLAAERDSSDHALVIDPHAPALTDIEALEMVQPGSPSPVAVSARMREVLELARRVAESKLTVLVNGETGVGKEKLAEFIHHNSDRRDKPEIRINCAAIPETMIEAEFFGFERGSFTGAVRSTRGKFELADGGSLFLDEIGELSLAMQVKLLRVLNEQRFYRLGAAQPCQVDVRVIAITNRDLANDVRDGRFREDLFYRLNVVTIKIPPLRERPEDIPPLVDRLVTEFCDRTSIPIKKLALEAYDLLYSYPWRGNVRELRNVIERSVVVSKGNYITGEDLIRAVPDLALARSSFMRMPSSRPSLSMTAASGGAPMRSERATGGRDREQGVIELIRRRPDIGLQEILREVGTSKSTGIRLVNELIARGQVVRRDRGKRSRYRLADHLD